MYRFAPTGEYCALRDVDNGMALKRWLFDLYNELDADPALQDLFAQQLGAVGAITAEQSGAVGNKDAKDVLTLVSPAGTVLAEAIILYTAGGADAMAPAETQQALRSLLSARDDLESIADLRALALDFPGAALRECYLVPGATGIGTYTLLPVLADGQFCGPNLRAAFLAYMQARVTFDVLTTSAVYEAVDSSIATLAVQVSGIYAPDWVLPGESNEGFVVNASTTQTLTLDNVTGIRIGSRVLVASNGSSGPYVVQRTVTSIASFSVTLDEALPFPVDLGGPITSRVTPGGPLGNAIVDAIYAAYEARAPSVADTGAAARYPSPIVPDSVSGILAAVSSVEGVADVDYVGGSPPALATPGGVLVPGMVILMSTERL
ncbi:MAG TPA: baseplate J/gp47 family protein [Polyangiales bacterium]|nr:baseplate J/gp47 family protein [Polyangiales bacterium]